MVKLKVKQFIQKKDMEDIKQYIYVLDYSDCTICEIAITEELKDIELEDILEKFGCNVNTCSFMIADCKIDSIIELNEENK